jgi:quercetin dioxygenase-like cupin family protein
MEAGMKYSLLVLGMLVALGLSSPSAAQDPLKTNPNVYHLMFENETVRVLHVSVAPGGKTTMHEHPDNAVILLQDAKMRFTGTDGKSQDVELKANEAMWSPAGKHMGENIGKEPIDGVIIELKGNRVPTATIPTSRPDTALTQLFDNPRAQAIKMTIQRAFHEAAGTTHDFDQVVVALQEGDISLNVGGKTKTHWKPGDAEFIGRGAKHESQNTGQKPVDVFILAIK